MPLEPFLVASTVPIEVAGAVSTVAVAAGVALWRELRRERDQNQANAVAYITSMVNTAHIVDALVKASEKMVEELRKERA